MTPTETTIRRLSSRKLNLDDQCRSPAESSPHAGSANSHPIEENGGARRLWRIARVGAQAAVALEHRSEEAARKLLGWKPLKRWCALGVFLGVLAWMDLLGAMSEWATVAHARLTTLVGAWLQTLLEWLLAGALQSMFRLLLGTIALLGTVELISGHWLERVPHWPTHLSLPTQSLREREQPIIAMAAVSAVMLCWYVALFPPDAWTLMFSAWRATMVSISGFLLCTSLFEDDGWKYLPISAVCLAMSGAKSQKILLALDGLAAIAHSFKYFKRLYFLHEAKQNFHRRVRRVMDMNSFHPAFVEESFERLVHCHLRSTMARRLAFALQRGLSFGTQARMLRQNYENLQHHLSKWHPEWAVTEEHLITIDRENLLPSSFKALQEAAKADLLADNLKVNFVGEIGQDEGGLLREWLDSLGRQLTEEAKEPLQLSPTPGADQEGGSSSSSPSKSSDSVPMQPLLIVQECDHTLVVRPCTGRFEDFYSLGRLLASAVIRGERVPLHFSRAAWKLLIGTPIEAADVYAIDPQFFTHRIAAVLEPGGLKVMEEVLGEPLTFMSAESPLCPVAMELVPGGLDKLVTDENKVEYVAKLCEFYLCGQVGREWQLIGEGFEEILPRKALAEHGIKHKDIELLIAGLPAIDVDDWKEHTAVDGPLFGTAVGDKMQTWFWEVVEHFGDERRAKLLQFATGSSRVPGEGFKGLKPSFCLYLADGSPGQLPTASTCTNQLNLVAYETRWQMIEKLKTICHDSVATGFGLA